MIDQTKPLPDGRGFHTIGTVELEAETETVLQVANKGTTGFVVVDAFQLLPLD